MNNNGIINKDINRSFADTSAKGASFALPAIIITSMLTVSSYIVDAVSSAITASGNGIALSSFLYGCSSVTASLVYSLISAGIAMKIGGYSAFAAGLIGGMIAGIGTTTFYPSGNANSISGIWGSVITGVTSGYCVIAIDKIHSKLKTSQHVYELLRPIVPIIFSLATGIVINHIAGIINLLTTTTLAVLSKNNLILCVLLAGVFINLDSFGATHLAAYLFSAASCATGDTMITASITAAYISAPIGIALCAAAFRDKFTDNERKVSYSGVLCGIFGAGGITQYQYVKKPLAVIPGVVSGGATAAVLSLLMGCSAQYPSGGLLMISGITNPLNFILSTLCGGFISATVIGLMLRPIAQKENENTEAVATITA